MHIRLTSVLDDVVEDWIPGNTGGQGNAQFAELTPDPEGAAAGALPLTPDYPGECCEASLVWLFVWSVWLLHLVRLVCLSCLSECLYVPQSRCLSACVCVYGC